MKFLRKTVVGVSTLVLTAATLATATYAWFPINSKSDVKDMKISVTGGQGFMVSVDGINYSNDLTQDQIYGAMLVRYQPDRFAWKYNADLNKSELYSISVVYTEKDGNIEREVTYDQVATESQKTTALKQIQLMPITSMNGRDMKDLYNSTATATSGRYTEFQVYFRTTSISYTSAKTLDGFNSGIAYYKIDSETGKYVLVDTNVEPITEENYQNYYIYKSKGDYKLATKYVAGNHYYQNIGSEFVDVTDTVTKDNFSEYYVYDGLKYDIYLNGSEQVADTTYGQEAYKISPTKFTSASTEITLGATMNRILGGSLSTLGKGDKCIVYSSNALRLSITDEDALAAGTGATNIYELGGATDDEKMYNYGSYATNYSDKVTTTINNITQKITEKESGYETYADYTEFLEKMKELYGEQYCVDNYYKYSNDLGYLYDYQYNAMYTYYSNLKKATSYVTSPLHGSLMKYEDMPTTIKDLNSNDNKKITTLLSGAEGGTLITFRIWLEGWDADCFDGLKEGITSTLSFTSKRIY